MPTLYIQPEISIQKLIVKHYLKVKNNQRFNLKFWNMTSRCDDIAGYTPDAERWMDGKYI